MKFILPILLISNLAYSKVKEVNPYDPKWEKSLDNAKLFCQKTYGNTKEMFSCKIHKIVECNEQNIKDQNE